MNRAASGGRIRRGDPLVLALVMLASANAASACDPLHEWIPIDGVGWREAKVQLLADGIVHALQDLGSIEGPVAIVSLSDQYARRTEALDELDPEPKPLDPALLASRERSLQAELQRELARAGLPALAPEAISSRLPAPDLAWNPEALSRFAAATGARHLVRIALMNYTASRVLERDELPINRDLYRARFSWGATLRVAILDAEGAVRWIDEILPSETLEEDFYERQDGRIEPVRRVAMAWGKDPETWHDIARHGGEDAVGMIPVLRKQ